MGIKAVVRPFNPFLGSNEHIALKLRLKSGSVLADVASDYTRLQTLYLSMMDGQVISSKDSPTMIGPATTPEEMAAKEAAWLSSFGIDDDE